MATILILLSFLAVFILVSLLHCYIAIIYRCVLLYFSVEVTNIVCTLDHRKETTRKTEAEMEGYIKMYIKNAGCEEME
jgi:hypothetical protein